MKYLKLFEQYISDIEEESESTENVVIDIKNWNTY